MIPVSLIRVEDFLAVDYSYWLSVTLLKMRAAGGPSKIEAHIETKKVLPSSGHVDYQFISIRSEGL